MRTLIGLMAAALVLAGCGGEQSDPETVTVTVTPTPAAPAAPVFVETETCRTSAANVLDDAQLAAGATDSATIERYALLAERGTVGLDCSSTLTEALSEVVRGAQLYAQRWSGCEIAGQWMDWNGDGQPDGTGDCTDANRLFVSLSTAIDAARAMVDAKS